MNRYSRIFAAGLLALTALAPAVLADDPSAGAGGHAHVLGGFRRCLHNLDLTADQKTAIQSLVSAARPGLQADRQTLRGDSQKLQADIAAGADTSTLGQDVLTRHSHGQKMQSDVEALKGQVLAKLSTDQQNAMQSCLQSSAAAGRAWGPTGSN
jgi:Spy/CpxP family protein refolding chaperone